MGFDTSMCSIGTLGWLPETNYLEHQKTLSFWLNFSLHMRQSKFSCGILPAPGLNEIQPRETVVLLYTTSKILRDSYLLRFCREGFIVE